MDATIITKLPPMKKCYVCKENRPFTDFHKKDYYKALKIYECLSCRRARIKDKNFHLQKFWPELSPEDRTEKYKEMQTQQNDLCAICSRPETAKCGKTTRRLAVDHCHKTGKVRSLLCADCNRGLGVFKENTDFMQSAIKYLLKHK